MLNWMFGSLANAGFPCGPRTISSLREEARSAKTRASKYPVLEALRKRALEAFLYWFTFHSGSAPQHSSREASSSTSAIEMKATRFSFRS